MPAFYRLSGRLIVAENHRIWPRLTPEPRAAHSDWAPGFLTVLALRSAKIGRVRKRSRFQIIDAAPAFDPWQRFLFALGVKRQADHDVAAAGPMLAQSDVAILHPLEQDRLRLVQRVPVLRVPDASLSPPVYRRNNPRPYRQGVLWSRAGIDSPSWDTNRMWNNLHPAFAFAPASGCLG